MKLNLFLLVCILSPILLSVQNAGYCESETNGFVFKQEGFLICNQNGPNGLLLESSLFYRPDFTFLDSFGWGLDFMKTLKIELGLMNSFTPSDDLLGLKLSFEPLPFFDIAFSTGLIAIYNYLGYGYFQTEKSDENPYAATNSQSLRENRTGSFFNSSASVKMRYGPVIFISSLKISYYNITNSDGYFLERRSFLYHKSPGIDFTSDNGILLEQNNGSFLAGLNYSIVTVPETGKFYQKPCLVFIFKPEYQPLKDVYSIIQLGYNIELRELVLLYGAGFSISI